MSFVKLEKRIGVAEAKLGASMSMRIYKGSPKVKAAGRLLDGIQHDGMPERSA